ARTPFRNANAGSGSGSPRRQRSRSSGRSSAFRRSPGRNPARSRARLSRSCPARHADTAAAKSWWQTAAIGSLPRVEKFLDAAADLATDDLLIGGKLLAQIPNELTGSVAAFDLAVPKQLDSGQNLLSQNLHARQGIVHRPVVAVREMERIEVAFVHR